jgi:hypothetical protein
MIFIPKCKIRNCKNFLGAVQPDGTELTERVICKAYPKGIPDDIAYGDNLHLEVRPDQENEIVFEEKD